MPPQDDAAVRRWVETWARAGPRLAEIQRRELRTMTHQQRMRLIHALFQARPLFAETRTTSGLVEQQRLFRKARQ
jgi:hypothetical protein